MNHSDCFCWVVTPFKTNLSEARCWSTFMTFISSQLYSLYFGIFWSNADYRNAQSICDIEVSDLLVRVAERDLKCDGIRIGLHWILHSTVYTAVEKQYLTIETWVPYETIWYLHAGSLQLMAVRKVEQCTFCKTQKAQSACILPLQKCNCSLPQHLLDTQLVMLQIELLAHHNF